MVRAIVGTRIREYRRQIGVTQAALADRIGISASYLNLIERNKRRIAAPLLHRIAEALELDLADLDGAAEQRVIEALEEIAQLPDLQAFGIDAIEAGEFMGHFPGWARALVALARSGHDARETANILSDRLAHDPFLGETVHSMLTRIASIRSAAEILADFSDIPVAQRDRFLRIVFEESNGLSEVGEALAAYFDKLDQPKSSLTPLDEVEALFDAHDNRFAEIDAIATPDDHAARIDGVIGRILDTSPHIETEAARSRATAALRDYGQIALRMPLARFAEAAARLRYDVERLAEAFAAPVDAVCQRLTMLPHAPRRPRFGYFQANAAGTLIRMRGLPGLNLPRYASACPLWALYRAQQWPESVMRQRALFPTGSRFVFVARARRVGRTGFGHPQHFVTDMLALNEQDAALTVYHPGEVVPLEEVGPACRLCPRTDCTHRVADPLTG